MKEKKNRLTGYFTDRLKDMAFIEPGAGVFGEDMDGVPVPVTEEDIRAAADGGLTAGRLAKSMVEVTGCDPDFAYSKKYISFMRRTFDEDMLVGIINNEGLEALNGGDPVTACVRFRAALSIRPDDADAMYGYARACRDVYMDSEDDIRTGDFKAESIEYFEKLTLAHPEAAEGHYYLGYGYLNMGLYVKADLAFREYLKLSPEGDEADEVRERLAQLRDPVEIEKGCNKVIAGRYAEGIDVLERYLDTGAKNWWPLHYYLGVAYEMTGYDTLAIDRFRNVLKLNASHTGTMDELAGIYERLGDKEMSGKYRRKIGLIKNGG